MKVLVHGSTGQMGQIVCQMAKAGRFGASLAAQVAPSLRTDPANAMYNKLDSFSGFTDCVVDFSDHAATKTLLDWCATCRFPVVIATTGQTDAEREMINQAAKIIPIFFSANMSVGIAVLADLVGKVAAAFPEADIEIIEKHHNRKKDVPSGTALMLANAIKEVRPNAEFNIGRSVSRKRRTNEIGIHSVRIGNEVGTHEIIISNGTETVTIKHEAEDRSLFAEGALKAARFIIGKPAGIYTMRDYLKEA